MKGFVPTPAHCVDLMVRELFHERPPRADQLILDAGCGEGAFIEGILRYCGSHRLPIPRILGVDSDSRRLVVARAHLGHVPEVELQHADFLLDFDVPVDGVIGNPPYVSILGLDEVEKNAYRKRFATATGRFDLYVLFFEKALELLRPSGRLVFITPEKYTYVDSARSLRRMLGANSIRKLLFTAEDMFPDLVTYPLITVVEKASQVGMTFVSPRERAGFSVQLPKNGESWAPATRAAETPLHGTTLSHLCARVSCGIATGRDRVFVMLRDELPDGLEPYALPTISGREIRYGEDLAVSKSIMLVPYDKRGRLRPLPSLGPFADYLKEPHRRSQLELRTCARRKPWHAFHETPVLTELLQPKILVKDISARPQFVLDPHGEILPRHSVYYIIPKRRELLLPLFEYLRGPEAHRWLLANCQKAANGFIRIQSQVLKRLPVPPEIVPTLKVPAAVPDASPTTA